MTHLEDPEKPLLKALGITTTSLKDALDITELEELKTELANSSEEDQVRSIALKIRDALLRDGRIFNDKVND